MADRDFRLLWWGGFVYFLSIFAQIVARGWLARELTGTNTGLGAVVLAFGVTSLLFTPLGGVAADRFPKRTVLLVSSVILALSSGGLALAISLDVVTFWMLMVSSALQALGFAGMVPARMAFSALIVGPRLLPNAVVLSQISMNANRVIGPALAGVLIELPALGIGGVYWVGTALNLGAMVLFVRLPHGARDAGVDVRSPWAELTDGLSYARRHPTMLVLLATSTAAIMFGFAYVAFLPTVSDEFFDAGSGGFAALSSIGAVGGLITSVALAGRVDADNAWGYQTVAGLGFGVTVALLGVAPTLVVAIAVGFVLGGATAAFQSVNGTLVLATAAPAYHGRMQSLLNLGFSAFGLAALPLGILADAIGLRATLVLMGGLTTVAVALSALWRARVAVAQPAGSSASASSS